MELAKDMRAWMAERKRPFTVRQICEGLGIPPGTAREPVRWTIQDFLRRQEIEVARRSKNGKACLRADMHRQARTYRYNHAWRPQRPAPRKARILKAMHVYGGRAFSSSDIQRLSGARDKNFVNKIIRELVAGNYLEQLGTRICAHGYGREYLYTVVDRGRFRKEMMGPPPRRANR